jgi:hypothetical protein
MQRNSRYALGLIAAFGVACTDAPTPVAPPSPAANVAAADPSAASAIALSTGGQGWQAAAAIDAVGKSVAVWMQRTSSSGDQMWAKGRPANGPWGATSVLSNSLQTAYPYPTVRTTTAGAATAVWSDDDEIWTADRSPAGVWSPAQLIVSEHFITRPIFVMNSQGDAAVFWGSGGVPLFPTQLNARRRSAGGAWGATKVVATGNGNRVIFDHAAIAENTGELVVTWERFRLTQCPYCQPIDFVLHVTRVAKGSSNWQNSGPLTPPSQYNHDAYPAIDPAKHAGVVYLPNLGTVVAIKQSSAGAGWSAPVTVHTSPSMILTGLAIDLMGRATVALLDISARKVIAINGNIVNNTWGSPTGVSAGDFAPSQVSFALATNGAGVLTWANATSYGSNPRIRLSVRGNSSAAWSAPQTISPAGVYYPSPEAAAVNAAGKVIVIFGAYNSPATVHTEYATNR